MVWTGREVVIASAQTAQRRTVTRAGRYDPDRARWTPIAPLPRSRVANLGRVTLEWTGSAVVEPGSAAYDPAVDRWLPLPAEPDQARLRYSPRARPAPCSGSGPTPTAPSRSTCWSETIRVIT